MAPQRPPSSPMSLLWAHQLKREHGFLLDRMKKLETEIAGVESRTKAAADTAIASEIATIAKKVQSLAEDGSHVALDKIRQEVMGRFEGVGAEIEAVTVQLSTLERNQAALEEEGSRTAVGQMALLKRIKEVQGSMVDYERNVTMLGKKINDQAIGKIREVLEGLCEDVRSNRLALDIVHVSLETLSEADKLLREGNERLAEEVKELQARPTHVPTPAAIIMTRPVAADSSEVQSQLQPGLEKQPGETVPAKNSRPTNKTGSESKTTRSTARKQPAGKMRPPSERGAFAAEQNAAENSEPVIDERLKLPIIRRGRGWIEVVEAPDEAEVKSEYALPKEVGPPKTHANTSSIVTEPTKGRRRAHRAVEPPALGFLSDDAMPPPKRGPGRPRKDGIKAVPAARRRIIQPEETSHLETDTPVTSYPPPPKRGRGRPRKDALKVASAAPRRRIVQPDEIPLATKEMAEDEATVEAPAVHGQQKTKASDVFDSPERPKKIQRRGLTNIFSSPISSPKSLTVETTEPVPEL